MVAYQNAFLFDELTCLTISLAIIVANEWFYKNMEYVLILAKKNWFDGQVLVIEKTKPEWMAGRINLIGGKVESNENPAQAAIRELKEETGLIGIKPIYFGMIQNSSGEQKVYCYVIYTTNVVLNPQADEVEKVYWVDWESLKNDPRLLPSLKIIVPMMLLNVAGWTLIDDNPIGENSIHACSIKIKY